MTKKQKVFKDFFGVYKYKLLLKQAIILFLQTLALSLVSLGTSLVLTFYNRVWHIDNSYNGMYFYSISKVYTTYRIILFTPMIYQLGVLIIASNLYGKNKLKEIAILLRSTIYISLIINALFFSMMFFIIPYMLSASGVRNQPIYTWNSQNDLNIYFDNLKVAKQNNLGLDKFDPLLLNGGTINGIKFNNSNAFKAIVNESRFIILFTRVAGIELFIFSIGQVLCASLQATNKSIYSTIAYSLGLLFRLFWTSIIVFGIRNSNPLALAFEGIIGSTIQLLLALIFAYIFIFKKEENHLRILKENINFKFIRKVLLLGFPIALETGVWFIMQFLLGRVIPSSNLSDKYIGLYKVIGSVFGIIESFIFGISYVTSSEIAKELGKNNIEEAKLVERSLFKLAIYGQIIFGIIGIILTYPLLKIFAIDTQTINKYGYWLMLIVSLIIITDTGNMVTLRALWGANIVWLPVLVSVISMIGLQIGATSLLQYSWLNNHIDVSSDLYFFMFYLSTMVDPITRTITYKLIWNSKIKKGKIISRNYL
ncbi:MATE family efflux transporter [Mycoplasma sp. Mirounga ES2805-ORL]|uniref:MATE family efflux transporter n=1 Tax=Mycoplasma sp. Mirounga ES2805-ORL TaxID=754514 RepID=UPI00197C73B0|nr:MATE family efflux transporter [Mycoplasma sp. Mirounga ES2805-ORL]QSF13930.1 MATE family efflux transporter [Mycoplasma sp. Mirounga ES2805-ORL]